jgi:hypothetical protein
MQDPTGKENEKNIYFGFIMGVSAALPTCLHLFLFSWALLKRIWIGLFRIPKQVIKK